MAVLGLLFLLLHHFEFGSLSIAEFGAAFWLAAVFELAFEIEELNGLSGTFLSLRCF